MKSTGFDPGRRDIGVDVESILQRATAMEKRSRQSLLELNAIRARAELALRHASEAVFQAHQMLRAASEHLVTARGRTGEPHVRAR